MLTNQKLGMAWVQIMENILSARPSSHEGFATAENQQQPAQENLESDMDTFDFERYLYVFCP